MASVFVETNILLYHFDYSTPVKHETSRQRLANLDDSLAPSPQVLQAYCWNKTKKRKMTPWKRSGLSSRSHDEKTYRSSQPGRSTLSKPRIGIESAFGKR